MDRVRGLHAQQHLVRVMIVFAQIVAVVGGYQRNVQLFFQAEEVGMDLLFQLQALVLNFQKEIAPAEDVLVLAGGRLARSSYLPAIRFSQSSPARQPENPIRPCGMLGQIVLADARLAIEAVQRGLRGNADQVAVALFVFRQHQQMVVVVALRSGAMVLLVDRRRARSPGSA